jgi:hypothetical protein
MPDLTSEKVTYCKGHLLVFNGSDLPRTGSLKSFYEDNMFFP